MRGRWATACLAASLFLALGARGAPLLVHEFMADLGRGPVLVRYLYVAEWWDDYRLIPTTPESGVGTLAPLEEMARTRAATAAVNANFFDPATGLPVGLLIRDGIVERANHGRRAALGIDLLGRLVFFHPQVSLYVRSGEGKVAVDDVNRPIRTDELVLYTESYVETIAPSPSQMLRVVRIHKGQVVGAGNERDPVPDGSASLLVASGAARTRIAFLSVGDEAAPGYDLDEGPLLITDAVSAGPLLVDEGRDALDLAAEGFDPDSALARGLAARSVLATDWTGGLLLLTVTKDATSVGADFWDLVAILQRLPTPVRSAIAFDGGHSSSLVLREGAGYRELGSGGEVAVGLLLVPKGR